MWPSMRGRPCPRVCTGKVACLAAPDPGFSGLHASRGAMTALSSKTAYAARSARVLPAQAGRALQDLAGLDDRILPAITRTLPCSSARRAAGCDLLVGRPSAALLLPHHSGSDLSAAQRGGWPDRSAASMRAAVRPVALRLEIADGNRA